MFDWQPEALQELELTWATGLAGLLVAVGIKIIAKYGLLCTTTLI